MGWLADLVSRYLNVRLWSMDTLSYMAIGLFFAQIGLAWLFVSPLDELLGTAFYVLMTPKLTTKNPTKNNMYLGIIGCSLMYVVLGTIDMLEINTEYYREIVKYSIWILMVLWFLQDDGDSPWNGRKPKKEKLKLKWTPNLTPA